MIGWGLIILSLLLYMYFIVEEKIFNEERNSDDKIFFIGIGEEKIKVNRKELCDFLEKNYDKMTEESKQIADKWLKVLKDGKKED